MPTDARGRLIGSAIELMRRNGAAGTGVNELVEHSGVARRSIYTNFPGGKDELLAAATTAAGKFISAGIRKDEDPQAALASFVAMWRTVLVESDFDAGCPIAAGALAGTASPAARAAAGEVFEHWQERLSGVLESHGAAPDEAATLATVILSAVEGAVILATASRSLVPVDRVSSQLSTMIDAAIGG
ncbi:MAG TPA: TetR family transcriptional regulator [Nocardioides sp.]|nr:TetR family transcriptional regulator [Nocardioides sp.]